MQHILTSLSRYIAMQEGRKFAWGTNDCFLFCMDFLNTHLNKDYAAPFRGKYNSRTTGQRELELKGHRHVVDYLDGCFERRKRVEECNVGDLVAFRVGKDFALGLAIGGKAVFLKRNSGIAFLRLRECYCSWKIDYVIRTG